MRKWLVQGLFLVWTALLAGAVVAQDSGDDKGFLTRFLERNLSGAGRAVVIDGFAGALSSRATFTRLTVADNAGVWLTITDGAIGWDRGALLSGRVEIGEMSAASIEIARIPSSGGGSGPSFEAARFSLPELPVSLNIGRVRADRLILGAPVVGEAVEATVDGSVALDGGAGSAQMDIARTDRKAGRFTLNASYSNATRDVLLDILASEGPEGIAATLLSVPGRPEMTLALHGSGRPEDFTADLKLDSGGEPRLTGRVVLSEAAGEAGPVRSFAADLKGDLAPLFLPEYRDFFGDGLTLSASGRREGDGRMVLDRLSVTAKAVSVDGALAIGPGGEPERAALRVKLGRDGGPTLLPVPGVANEVDRADLSLGYDAAQGDTWALAGTMTGFRRGGIGVDLLRIDGGGRVAGGLSGAAGGIDGSVAFTAAGFRAADAGLSAALGSDFRGNLTFGWKHGASLQVPALHIEAAGIVADGAFTSALGSQGPEIDGTLTATSADVSRFSVLIGQRLGGGAGFTVTGRVVPLTGAFDVVADIAGQNLTVGVAEADRLLAGNSTVRLDLRRDETGMTVRQADLAAASLTAKLSGRLATDRADLSGDVSFGDLAVLGPGYRGSLTARAGLNRANGVTRVETVGTTSALGLGSAGIDPLLRGDGALRLVVDIADGQLPQVKKLSLKTRELSVTANAPDDTADGKLGLSATLRDIALLVPGFSGPLKATGHAVPGASDTQVDLRLAGPGQIAATLTGQVATDGSTADLMAKGTAQAALINTFIAPRNVAGPVSFDLRLDGPLALSSVTGAVRLSGGRLAVPDAGLAVTGISAEARLTGARAGVTATGAVQSGGSVSVAGSAGLTRPLPVDLKVTLDAARLRDPQLFDTRVTGGLAVGGSLGGGLRASGDLRLSETEIRVPSTGLGYATFTGDVVHLRDSAAVRDTRRRAGFGKGGAEEGGGGRPVALDIAISAPNRIFVRGRGLDAEFGGSLRIGGTTAAIAPSGGFTMIRGRLDLLGKRFAISEGQLLLQGALIPTVHFEATTAGDGVSATVVVDGPASAPQVSFASSPQLPEEEIVAQILFGKGLQSLSPFQAAQLASAVASLTGKGGEGIVGRLRQSFGLDDLDVTGSGDGTFALKLGKYVSDNVYTNVEVDGAGKTSINLNLDIPPGVTLRGSLGSDGSSSLGAFVERDY
jgi:translocation and assembly module TamB